MNVLGLLLRAAVKKQKGSILGIFFLVLMLSLCLFSSLTLYTSGVSSVAEEMYRLGFGDFTVWTENQPESLIEEIAGLSDVESITEQPLIFAGYEVGGDYSDNEGQLIVFDGTVPYHFISEDGTSAAAPEIRQGTVYISPAMTSSFDVKAGDTIRFELARSHGIYELTVAGYFADAFMGSSMIDMKSFLISETDRNEMLSVIESAGTNDALGRRGAMLHITQREDSALTAMEFQRLIQEQTTVGRCTAFTYRQASILSYMLLLQNILSGFLIAFSAVLLAICLVVIGHNLSAVVEQEKQDMAILRTIGLNGSVLRGSYLLLYGGAALPGLLLGLCCAPSIAGWIAGGMVSSTGILVDIVFPSRLLLPLFLAIILLFAAFLFLKTRRVLSITPLQTIRKAVPQKRIKTAIRKRFLLFDLAVRELCSGSRRYAVLALIAALLTVFLSVIGRMGTWLGPNGEGLMNAFSVAEHDLGVQPFNSDVPMDEIERVIAWYSPIQETYELAMQSVTVNGLEYTANVLDDTDWFHVLRGKVCDGDEILITDTVASELELSVGDSVQVASGGRMENYTVSGVYQCANGMGSNIGMSIAGYSKIGDITGFIWCCHYVLKNGAVRDYAMKYLQENYRGIDVHTNSWSGLDGIVFVMHLLIVVIYLIAAGFILITVILSASKLLRAETGSMAVYKSMGLSTASLRVSFAIRFLLAVIPGTIIGLVLAGLWADTVIGVIFHMFGIGEFHSGFSLLGDFLPLLIIPALFFCFAFIFSARLKQISIVTLLSENNG